MIPGVLIGFISTAFIIGDCIAVPVGDTEVPFIFPEDIPIELRMIQNTLKKISCSNGSTLCGGVEDYPKDFLKNVLKNKADSFLPFFGVDTIQDSNLKHKTTGLDVDELSMCPSYEDVIFPEVGKNKEHKWHLIVNIPGYQQGIKLEKCVKKKDQSCMFTELTDHNLYKTSCQQKYIYRKLVALKPETGKVDTDSFPIPSCCVCSVKPVPLAERFGGNRFPMTPATTPKAKRK